MHVDCILSSPLEEGDTAPGSTCQEIPRAASAALRLSGMGLNQGRAVRIHSCLCHFKHLLC